MFDPVVKTDSQNQFQAKEKLVVQIPKKIAAVVFIKN